MIEEEYLELKEYLKQGIKRVEELEKQLHPNGPSYKLIVPSFEQIVMPTLTREEREIRDFRMSLLQQIGWQEIDNDLAAELIRSYEYDKK
jgi:hypothetical protein